MGLYAKALISAGKGNIFKENIVLFDVISTTCTALFENSFTLWENI
jgi:hypothetical protein